MALKSFTYQSSQIFYRVSGKGRPVLLLHGFGEDGEIWNAQVEFLKDDFLVIVPDLPGSGKSEQISDMSIEGMADLVKALTNTELNYGSNDGEKWLGVFGHSMGGYITLAFAEKYPARLCSFGLVHSTAFADSVQKKENRLKSINFIRNNGAYIFLKGSIPGLFHLTGHLAETDKNDDNANWPESYNYNPNLFLANHINELVEKGKNFSVETLISYYEAMYNRPNRTAVLLNFGGPVLFIIGVHDIAVPFQESLQQCCLANRSHIHILREVAHMGMVEEPLRVSEILMDFLKAKTF